MTLSHKLEFPEKNVQENKKEHKIKHRYGKVNRFDHPSILASKEQKIIIKLNYELILYEKKGSSKI